MAIRHQSIKFQNNNRFLKAEVSVNYNVDNNYGADRDGNRGVQKLLIEDVKFITCVDEDDNPIEVDDSIEDDAWEYLWENFTE